MTTTNMEGEIKNCPNCGNNFVCNNYNISNCGCMEVPLNNTARQLISDRYDGCLCVNCLKEINNQSYRT
ncbi:MAG: cysteine-rich CWC family protein [Cyclobacteriaceae bacterium]|nr:cysteine-rich CWC family protein [Cyclobacteriaceae bacterium]